MAGWGCWVESFPSFPIHGMPCSPPVPQWILHVQSTARQFTHHAHHARQTPLPVPLWTPVLFSTAANQP